MVHSKTPSSIPSGTLASPPPDVTAARPSRPRLLVTLGDPAGIGPEVVLKALSSRDWSEQAEITLVGNAQTLRSTYQRLVEQQRLPAEGSPTTLPLIEVPLPDNASPAAILGEEHGVSGELSFRTLQLAIRHCLAGGYAGIVTAPIAKSAWRLAGHLYPGQTELLAEMAGCDRTAMLFVARSPYTGWRLRTLLATTHIPLAAVPSALSPAKLTLKLELLLTCLQKDFGIQQPRIAIAGLNPHSGEQGQLGREEVDWLIPWLVQQRQRFPAVTLTGPIPPDTLWVPPGQAWFLPTADPTPVTHDAYLALYHDQGLIPVKLMAFDRAVNTTLGLPFVRTSPDHGTAFDIAGLGIARPDSMVAALELAIELAQARARDSAP